MQALGIARRCMEDFMRLTFRLVSFVFAVCLLVACSGNNTIRLMYPASDASQLPPPSAKRVAVVMFEDMRSSQNIGVKRDGSAFMPSSSVTDWISRSFGDELSKKGFQVSYALTPAEAKNAAVDYIITGVTREVWLSENGPASVMASIRLSVTLSDKRKELFTDNMTATQEKPVLWSTSAVESLLQDALRSIIEPTAIKLGNLMR